MKELREGSSAIFGRRGGKKWGSHHGSYESHIKQRMFKTKIKALSGRNIPVQFLLYANRYFNIPPIIGKKTHAVHKKRHFRTVAAAQVCHLQLICGKKKYQYQKMIFCKIGADQMWPYLPYLAHFWHGMTAHLFATSEPDRSLHQKRTTWTTTGPFSFV